MHQRFARSGKESLILLVLSDFDPDGEEICQSFAKSMRDDFGVYNIRTVKVALTHEQVRTMKLPISMDAKVSSSNYAKFVSKYKTRSAYELEALEPEKLQSLLRNAIDSVMDVDAFNEEVDEEKEDAVFLENTRRTVYATMKEVEE